MNCSSMESLCNAHAELDTPDGCNLWEDAHQRSVYGQALRRTTSEIPRHFFLTANTAHFSTYQAKQAHFLSPTFFNPTFFKTSRLKRKSV